jgi:hypothetical protein
MIKTVGSGEDIKVGDEVRFVLETHDGSRCVSDPYQITDATIYFISREFTDSTASEYEAEFINPELQEEYDRVKQAVCIKSKQMVKAATTSDISLSGLQNVDGINLSEGDRVLVKDQADPSENGIYVATEDSWSRASDASSRKTVISGMYVFVENGISNIGTGWVLQADNPVNVGSSEMKFLLFAENFDPLSPDSEGLENTRRVEELKAQMEASKTRSPFFYKNAIAVKKFGGATDSSGEFFPAWLNPDNVVSELKGKVVSDNIVERLEDTSGVVPGKFLLGWSTQGMREGDYFICWTWRPTMGDETLSAHQFFYLSGNSDATASMPTHRVRQDKYDVLLERYTPEMFKTRISDNDLSPEILSEFNKAVARGFMFVENQAASVIDLLDSNSIHEQLLPLLSNMFNLKLKSGDSTLWRRQIKKAVPNFKRKGSMAGLKEAMRDAGMRLVRFSRLWQVVPKYTRQEHFTYDGSDEFELSLTPLSPSGCNIRLWLRGAENAEWTELGSCDSSSSSSSGHWSNSFVQISGNTMTWVGAKLSDGDSIRVLYTFRNVPPGEQAKEDYIRSLPLMDDRDERDQKYPPKNWNVHLIEEDDENFAILIPVRHPLADPIVWGRVRTEFPYSENLYNMEEYNGSKRDSLDPCDIDKSFMDSCGQCASSKFNMDIEVDTLSDESLKEAMQITEEYMPFHAIPNSFNLWGSMNEFVRQSEEKISAMIQFSREDMVLAGEGQHIFSRDVYNSDIESVRRNVLASFEAASSPSGTTWSGVAKNSRAILLSSITMDEDEVFNEDLGDTSPGFMQFNVNSEISGSDPFENGNLLEVLGSTVKYYSISSLDISGAVLNGDVDPALVGPVFEYRISNRIADLNVDISQYQEIIFDDPDVDFTITGVVSQYDVDADTSLGPAWKLLFGDKEYSVENVFPDGTLLIKETGTITAISGWKLMNGTTVKKEGDKGSKTVTGYGLVEVNSPSGVQVRDLLKAGDYVYLGWGSTPRIYRVSSFQKGSNKFYVKDRVDGVGTYDEGGLGSEDLKVYRRVMDKKIGQFGHDGLVVVADEDIQAGLGISNGEGHDPDSVDSGLIRENHVLFMDGDYYTISEVDGRNVRISGPKRDYDMTGEPVEFTIYRFSKERLALSEKQKPPYDTKPNVHEFNGTDEDRDEVSRMDRSGGFIISNNAGEPGVMAASSLLNSTEPLDVISHDEKIEYSIEYKEEK